jgi:uncharacterized protein (DUF1800 family)
MSIYLATNRFGYGARSDAPVAGDPRAYVAAQIAAFDPSPPAIAALPDRAALTDAFITFRETIQNSRPEQRHSAMMAGDGGIDPIAEAALTARREGRQNLRELLIDAAAVRMTTTILSPTPFAERWVHFWSNHFAISIDKIACVAFAGDYEHRAIRPHVFGNFQSLLLSAISHPAMMLFLDQAQSIGPNSPAARFVARRNPQRELGLNENLAREIMELHTLGVRTGYSQADVTAFAKALTGLTIAGLARGPARRLTQGSRDGDTVFVEALHEPGPQTVMGKTYNQRGSDQASAILSDLVANPATARHIATKVATHFVADDPSPALVARLEQSFRSSGGNLGTLARTLIASPEAWAPGAGKFKTPWDWTISAMRGLGVRELPNARSAIGMLQQLGQPIWRPGSPAGFADTAPNWAGPGALIDRVDLADRLAAVTGAGSDPARLAQTILADALTPDLSTAIARADSQQQGLAMLLVSPAFLRR